MSSYKKKLRFIAIILNCMILISCENSLSIEKFRRIATIEAEYTNPTGSNPSIKITKTSKNVRVDYSQLPKVKILNNDVIINFSNIRFEDDLGTYFVDNQDITVEEEIMNEWKQDRENQKSSLSSQTLDIVLVLDASASLGNDFTKVKEYAINFVKIIHSKNPSTRIGVVSFADTIITNNMTGNTQQVLSFISNMKQGTYTRLYQAMSTGITMLKESNANGRVLVTFTDGVNNRYDDVKFGTPDFVINTLKQPDAKIVSYTIGFTGKEPVDEAILKDLSVNGKYEFPHTMDDLAKVFNRLSASISSIYQVTYTRNISPVMGKRPIRINFNMQLL